MVGDAQVTQARRLRMLRAAGDDAPNETVRSILPSRRDSGWNRITHHFRRPWGRDPMVTKLPRNSAAPHLAVFLNRLYPKLQCQVVAVKVPRQIRTQFRIVAITQDIQAKRDSTRQKAHIPPIPFNVSLQLGKREIIRHRVP